MTLEEYQEAVQRTLNYELTYDQQITNLLFGLAGEIGEIIDRYKKHRFQGHDLDMAAFQNEIGDTFWYLTNLAIHLKIPLEVILQANVDKLRRRYPDGFNPEKSRNRIEYQEERVG